MSKPPAVPVIYTRYTHIAVQDALSNGRYTFLNSDGPGGTVVDEQSGTTTPLPDPAGCRLGSQPIIGGPWLLYLCATSPLAEPQIALYSLGRGSWRTTPINLDVTDGCLGNYSLECGPVRVGAHWIGWLSQCYHCTSTLTFQNIDTGRVVADPTQYGTVTSLGTAQLAHRICRPLTATPGGLADFIGPYAVIFDATSSTLDGAIGTYWLQRCGSSTMQRLGADLGTLGDPAAAIAANRKMVIWETFTQAVPQLVGERLPSRHRFRVRVPSDIPAQYGIVLSASHLYLNAEGGGVWSARLP